jgi:hypothetical protein
LLGSNILNPHAMSELADAGLSVVSLTAQRMPIDLANAVRLEIKRFWIPKPWCDNITPARAR